MEYCDRGSLQDAVDRGVFLERRPTSAAATGAAASAAGGGAGGGGGIGSGGSGGGERGGGSVRDGSSFVRLGESVDRRKLLSEEAEAEAAVEAASAAVTSTSTSPSSSPPQQHNHHGALSTSPPSNAAARSTTTRPNMPFIAATAAEIAAAMAYLHSLDVLHGDLTGGNVLLSSTPSAFGGSGGGGGGGAGGAGVGASASNNSSSNLGAPTSTSSPSAAAASAPPPAPPPAPSPPPPPLDLRGWTAKVADFGLARVLSCDAISTGTYGTVTHMPPELLTAGKLSKAADVYAFGVLLWEMYTGKRPWAGMLQMQVIFAVTIRRRKLAFPAGAKEEHPRFVSLAEDCMCAEAEGRPSFEEVRERLKVVEGAPRHDFDGYGSGGVGEGRNGTMTTEIEEVV